ncbi:hypothetical protein BL254_05655 [Protofrankia sp. BMG5.30]|uniref:Uncharacterized protein n=1 Tax=Protofrankia coriariae TaxID=1562887 RepID=A0ABR5F4X8_9ACTN|nr:hypothetical protein FrCorBMG51_09005 [Protofrankia coriariae]ONH36731.1 hypothetical protein BL254_05655 [Protofrankia sp. BMG5.30]
MTAGRPDEKAVLPGRLPGRDAILPGWTAPGSLSRVDRIGVGSGEHPDRAGFTTSVADGFLV